MELLGPHNSSVGRATDMSSEGPVVQVPVSYGGLVFLWSNFPSLMVDYCVQLGNLLLLITSPILIFGQNQNIW